MSRGAAPALSARAGEAAARPAPFPRVALVAAGELFGGVEQFILTYAVHLRRELGTGATVFLFHRGRLAEALASAGIETRVLPASVRVLRRELTGRSFDVVHAHGYKGTVLAALACRGTGLPVVKTEHGAVEPYRGWKRLKMAVYDRLDRAVTRRWVHDVAYITDDLRRRKGVTGRSGAAEVIPNGLPLFSAVKPAVPRQRETFTLGMVGRLSPIKGHGVLLEALEKIPDRAGLRVLVLGDGPLLPALRADAAQRGLAETIEFLGFQKDPHRWMAALDALVMPSFHEGLPYTLLEAMHLGVPVIASRVGGMGEILEDGRTAALVPPGDAGALAAAISALRGDAARRAALARAAQGEAARRFEIGAMAERYRRLYARARGGRDG